MTAIERPPKPRGIIRAIAPRLAAKTVAIPFSGCHIFYGPSVPRGYGVISLNGRLTYAHRAAWQVANGPIPEGMLVLHECDVPACINPSHLFLGSQSDNIRDMLKKARGNYENRARGEQHHMHGGGYKGEAHPRRKLSQVDVDAIRAAYATGRTQISLAAEFGIKQPQVSSIVRRESWV